MLSIELTSPRRMLPLAVRSRVSLYFTASASSFSPSWNCTPSRMWISRCVGILPFVAGRQHAARCSASRRCRTACRRCRRTRCVRHRTSRVSDRAGRDPRADPTCRMRSCAKAGTASDNAQNKPSANRRMMSSPSLSSDYAGGTRSRAMAASITARSSVPHSLSRPGLMPAKHREPLQADAVQPAQLAQRIRMIVRADIEVGIRVARADLQSGGLPAALVPAGRLAGLQRDRSAVRPGCRPNRDTPPGCAARPAVPPACCRRPTRSAPRTCPAQVTQSVPVCWAMRPAASMIWNCRCPAPGSGATSEASTASAASPARSRGIASTAYIGLTSAWVDSAATPPSTWMHIAPTAKNREATAAPSDPVALSRTNIDQVTAFPRCTP